MQAAPVASETAPPAPTLSHLGWEPVAGRGQRCGEQPAGLGWETEILITPQTASLFPGAFLDSACSHKARALQAGWSPLQVHQAGGERVRMSAPTQHLQGGAHLLGMTLPTVSHPERVRENG